MKRKQVAATLAVVGILLAPIVAADDIVGASMKRVSNVTGHTVFASMAQFDPNIAALAGLVEQKVVWFNGIIIFDTFRAGFAMATETDTCDPRIGTEFRLEDQNLSYVDPNAVRHVVSHYTFRCGERDPFASLANDTPAEEGAGVGVRHAVEDDPPGASVAVFQTHFREDVWITPTHNKTEQYIPPTTIELYNFALAVDFRFFNAGPILAGRTGANVSCPVAGAPGDAAEREGVFFRCRATEHDGKGGQNRDEIEDGDSFHGPCSDDPSRTCHTPDPAGSGFNQRHNHTVAEVDLVFSVQDRGGSSRACVDGPQGDPCRANMQCAPSETVPPCRP